MKEKNIVQLIKNKDIQGLKPVVLVYGNENLLKKQLINLFKEKTDKDIHILWGDETSLDEIEDIFSTGSLFSKGNIGFVIDADPFLESLNKKDIARLTNILNNILSSNNSIIFISNKEKIPSKEPYKSIVAIGDVVVSAKLTKKAFLISLKKKIQSIGKKIDDDTLKYLGEKLSYSLEYAKQEVEKLLIYISDKEKITKEDVDSIVTPKVEENIFSFVLSFFLKDKNSVKTLKNLLSTGYHPFEIQGLLLSYINKALLIYEFKDKGVSSEEAFLKAGIKHPAQKGTYQKIIQTLKKEDMINLLKGLYELENNQKIHFEDIEKKLEEFILGHINR